MALYSELYCIFGLDVPNRVRYTWFMQEWTSGEIREFRNHLQMTRARFGEMIGVSTNYVYMLEKGLRIPSKTLRILLDHLKKSKEKEVPTRD